MILQKNYGGVKMGRKLYNPQNVLDAARERINIMFDDFENIVISVSGGKDSTVVFELAKEEAIRRGRKINLFFLDQEAEYQATIDIIEYMMNQDCVIPHWYQIPLRMTNATSYEFPMLYAWGKDEVWMRDKNPEINEKYPDRFYPFIQYFEKQWSADTCHLVGLRAEESLNRLRAVVKNPGHKEYTWTTKTKGQITAYPIYDWTFEDVWHHISVQNIRYNKLYDFLYAKGLDIKEARVSNLIHENSFKCLTHLHQFEPQTYERLMQRIGGIHVAARYAKESMIYSNKKLPPRFENWKQYRDFLITTLPDNDYSKKIINRFLGQDDNEYIHKQQCRQMLIFDWENNIPITKKKDKAEKLSYWRSVL